MGSKSGSDDPVGRGKRLLTSIRWAKINLNGDLPPDVLGEVLDEIGILAARAKAIQNGIFRPPHGEPSPEQMERSEALWRQTTLEPPPPDFRRKLGKAAVERRRFARDALAKAARHMAVAGVPPKDISAFLFEQGFDEKSANEAAINARLSRERAKGLDQPISPTARYRQRPKGTKPPP